MQSWQARRGHFGRVAVAGISMALIAAACSSAESPDADAPTENGDDGAADQGDDAAAESDEEPIQFGMLTSLSGGAQSFGERVAAGTEVAVNEVNANGGCAGRLIEIVQEDDQGTPEAAVTGFNRLRNEGIQYIGGSVLSGAAIAIANLAYDWDGAYFITGAQTAVPLEEQTAGNILGFQSTNSMFGSAYHPWIAGQLESPDVIVMAENTDFGDADVETLTANWADLGTVNIVETLRFESTSTDFTSELTTAQNLDAPTIYLAASGIDTPATLLRQAEQFGLDKQFFVNFGIFQPELVETAQGGAEGSIGGETYNPSAVESEVNTRFVSGVEEILGRSPGSVDLYAWETIHALCDAVNALGSADDPLAVTEWIRTDYELESPRGLVTFTEQGRATSDFLFMRVEDGEFEVLERGAPQS